MAAKRADKTGEAAWRAQGERYMQRLLEDQQLRTRLLGAYTTARSAYGRMGNGKGATHALFEDPKLRKELIDVADALRQAGASLKEPAPKARSRARRRRRRRGLVLLAIAGVLAIVLSEQLRSRVLDMLFGAEEEFDYSSTTAPATPAPAGVAGS
jgi:hypothetical protein